MKAELIRVRWGKVGPWESYIEIIFLDVLFANAFIPLVIILFSKKHFATIRCRSVFSYEKSLEGDFETLLRESRLQNISTSSFPFLLNKLFERMKPEIAVNGFKGSGLYPLNRKAIQHRILITDMGNNQEHIVQEQILTQSLYLLKLCVALLTFKRFKETNNANSLTHPMCKNNFSH
ncbi:UNVERIFIED_CONTAM: hypothetical protein NCL1_13314 [Trichonephila clavipes]